jgi:ZIP family zinc transporter
MYLSSLDSDSYYPGSLPILVAASGTFIGSLISYLFADSIHKSDIGYLIACAAGMMTGCAFVLIAEAARLSGLMISLSSFFVGLVLMQLLDTICTKYLDVETFQFTGLQGKRAIRLFVMVIGLVLHSLGEGISLGLSASVSSESGSTVSTGFVVYTSLAIHNIPEAAALAFAFRSKGASKYYATILAVLANSPQSIMAIPSLSVFSSYASTIQYGMGIAAGCMLYAVVCDIYPESIEALGDKLKHRAAPITAITGIFVVIFDIYSHIQIR